MEGLVMKYFVLKPSGDDKYAEASRKAMRTYASVISRDNPKLSKELFEWADNCTIDHQDSINEKV